MEEVRTISLGPDQTQNDLALQASEQVAQLVRSARPGDAAVDYKLRIRTDQVIITPMGMVAEKAVQEDESLGVWMAVAFGLCILIILFLS